MPYAKAQAVHPTVNLSLEPVSISRMGTYGSCATKGYLHYKLGERPRYEAGYFWVGGILHTANEKYYKREVESVVDGALLALSESFEKNNLTKAHLDAAIECGGIEACILEKFTTGEILNPKGERYTAPDRTKAYKELAGKMGLYQRMDLLRSVTLGKMDPEESLAKLVSKVLILAERYDNTIRYDRDLFTEVRVEEGFDFSITLPSGRDFRFRGFLDLVAKHVDGTWWLIDYKSGAAKEESVHRTAAHSSLQLTLYWFVVTKLWGLNLSKIALHYLAAPLEADTTRTDADWNTIVNLAEAYLDNVNNKAICPRLLYDSMVCQSCELRDACIAHLGNGTVAADTYAKELANVKPA